MPAHRRRLPLARAKDTSRSEARRRARAQIRAQREAELREESERDSATDPAPQAEARPSFFRPPNFREDIVLLPRILTSRRLMGLPPLVLVVGFVLTYLLGTQQLPEAWIDLAALYVYFLFIPQALLVFFLGGFLAQRASYLVGLLLGLFNGLLWTVLVFTSGIGYSPEEGVALLPRELWSEFSISYVITGALFGTLAAAFAAWYRDFLRRMQEQGRARRAEREAKERAQRRDQRQQDRKTVRQRSSR